VNGSELVVPVLLGQDAIVTVEIWASPAPYNHKLTRNGENQLDIIISNNVRN